MEDIRVLVVDDEPGMRLGVARALRDYALRLPELNGEIRFEVAQAASGEEALELLDTHKPEIILLDHKLPGMSGLDVLQRLADRNGDALAIMITAYASLDVAINATKRGAFDFLAKPFTPEELKGALRKAAKHLLLQRQAKRLAEEKRQVRFQFISVLAHELKAPIGAIQGFLQIIRDRSAGEDQAVYEHMLDRSLIRLDGMRKLILDLLDLTRIESGQKKRELAEVDLAAVAAEAIESFTPAANEMNVTIALHGGPLIMQADRGEVEIMLNNLVSNAVKYNRRDGRVDITLSGDGQMAKIVVADTGIGMSAEDAGRLFGEFTRIKNARTRDIVGSGLGLSIVKKLAALYGGSAEVSSTPDVGSAFTITLQRRQNEGGDAAQ